MSNDEQQDAEFPEEEKLPTEEPEEEPPSLPPPEKAGRKGFGSIAWLALVIALMSAAIAGYYLVFQGLRAQREVEENASALATLRSRLASSDDSLSSLDEDLTELAEADANPPPPPDREALYRRLDELGIGKPRPASEEADEKAGK